MGCYSPSIRGMKGLMCVDLTRSSPLTQTGMADFVPGQAVIDVAQRKRGKYMAKFTAIGYGFLPFSFSSSGELEADAVTLLKRIRKFSMAQDIGARAATHICNRISFAIAKGYIDRPDSDEPPPPPPLSLSLRAPTFMAVAADLQHLSPEAEE
ncbi:hypothetical protein Tco_0697086 [Tanacetum coccineum]